MMGRRPSLLNGRIFLPSLQPGLLDSQGWVNLAPLLVMNCILAQVYLQLCMLWE